MMPRGRGRDKGVVGSRSRAGSARAARSKTGGTPMLDERSLVWKVSEVAARLNADVKTVHKLIRARELLALDLRVKGSPKATYRITRESLDAYMAQARMEAP